jgi:hypothetical protein
MAEVVAGDAASVFAVDHGVRVVCPVWILASKWMIVNVAACGVDLDAVHGCVCWQLIKLWAIHAKFDCEVAENNYFANP